jgi:hypothetical protein
MITLFLKSDDIPELTSFSGNIDSDSLKPYIYIAQTTDIKRVLGKALYDKIYDDYVADTLTGEYEKIFNEYIIDMLVYYSCSAYVAFGGYKIANNGIFKSGAEGSTIVESKEVDTLISRYRQLGSSIELQLADYLKTITLPEHLDSTENISQQIIPWY